MAVDDNQQQMGLLPWRRIVAIVRRRRLPMVGAFVLTAVIGLCITVFTKPSYMATTELLFKHESGGGLGKDMLDLPILRSMLPDIGHDIPSQIEILQSGVVNRRALQMAQIPARQSKIVDVRAEQIEDTDAVNVFVRSRNPAYAQAMAIAIGKSLREYLINSKQTGVSQALKWVALRHQDEADKLATAELAVTKFKQQKRIVDLSTDVLQRSDQLAQLREALRQDDADLAGARAVLDQLQAERRSLPETINQPTVYTNVEQKQAIQDKISDLLAKREALQTLLQPSNPRVKQLDAQIDEMRHQLQAMPDSIKQNVSKPNPDIDEYDSEIAVQRGRVASLVAGMAKLKASVAVAAGELDAMSSLENQESLLQREVERRTVSEAELAKTLDDLSVQEKSIDNPVEVISLPEPAIKTWPILSRMALLFGFLGILVAISTAAVLEYIDDRIYSLADATSITGAPPLGIIARTTKDPLLNTQPTSGSGRGAVLESYRALRANVQFTAVDAPLRTMLVTSCGPGEGKTVTAINLAHAAAINGQRVILIDADLRRPRLHKLLNLNRKIGLTSVLIGRHTLTEALHATHIPGLQILPSGPIPPNPTELLSSFAMRDLLGALAGQADLVVVDSAPVLVAADAQVLANTVDGVLFVVEFGEARRADLRLSTDLLSKAHARIIGMVFNKADAKSGGYYSYGYSYGNRYVYNYGYTADTSSDQDALEDVSSEDLNSEFHQLPRARSTDTDDSGNGSEKA